MKSLTLYWCEPAFDTRFYALLCFQLRFHTGKARSPVDANSGDDVSEKKQMAHRMWG